MTDWRTREGVASRISLLAAPFPALLGNIKALLRSSRAEIHVAEAKEKAEIKQP